MTEKKTKKKVRLFYSLFTFAIIMASALGYNTISSAKSGKFPDCKIHTKNPPAMKLQVKTKTYTRTNESSKVKKVQTISLNSMCGMDQIVWKSSNTKIATVKAIKNKAKKATLTTYLGKKGTAKITASVRNKKTKKVHTKRTIKITVNQGATGVQIVDKDKKEITTASVALTGTLPLYSKVLPSTVNINSQKKVSWSIADASTSYASIDSSNALIPNQQTLLGRGDKGITVNLKGYKSGSNFEQSLLVNVDGGKLAAADAFYSDLNVKIGLSVSGDLSILKDSTLTLTGTTGNATGKTLKASYVNIEGDKALFKLDNTGNVLTSGNGSYDGTYSVTSSIDGILFSQNQITYKEGTVEPVETKGPAETNGPTETKDPEKEDPSVKLEEEIKKFNDVSFTADDILNATIGMDPTTPLSSGYDYVLSMKENIYTIVGGDKKTLQLILLNVTEKDEQDSVTITVTDTVNNISMDETIMVTVPVTNRLAKLNTEAAKFIDISFLETSQVGDKLEMSLSSALSADYDYYIEMDQNEYIAIDSDDKTLVLSQTVKSKMEFTVTITVYDLLGGISDTPQIKVTLPPEAYVGANISTIQFRDNPADDYSHMVDYGLTSFMAAMPNIGAINLNGLSIDDFTITGQDKNATVVLSKYTVKGADSAEITATITGSNGNKITYVITLVFPGNQA